MTFSRKLSLASALAIAVGLTACGGGSGSDFVSTVPPPLPPPPPPSEAQIGAAAQATLPAAGLFPTARDGGETIDAHAATSFPLIESIVTISSAGLDAEDKASGELTFSASGNLTDDFSLDVPGLGISALELAAGGYYCYAAVCGDAANNHVELEIADPANNLSWTTYGFWTSQDYGAGSSISWSAFVTGYKTPTGSVPTAGTATYNGVAAGRLMTATSNGYLGVGVDWLSGDAMLQADFGSGDISGSLTNMTGPGGAWNSVSLLGAISGGDFTGTTAATSFPATVGSMSGSATGTFAGSFFGPTAQELGAVWTLYDGHSTAIGTIAASHGP